MALQIPSEGRSINPSSILTSAKQRPFWQLVCLVGFALASGCAHNRNLPTTSPSNQPPQGDPFFNSTPTSRSNPKATPVSQDPLKDSRNQVPTQSTSQSSSGSSDKSSATLMAPLTINPGTAALATSSNQGIGNKQDPSWSPSLQQVHWNAQNTPGTLEHSLTKLRQLGAVEERLIYREGRWLFSCEFVNPQNPNQRRHYEHEDISEVAVVRAVLEQIERQK